MVNVYLHRIAFGSLIPAIEALLQLILAQYPAALGDELLQQLVFVGGELDRLARERDRARAVVEGDGQATGLGQRSRLAGKGDAPTPGDVDDGRGPGQFLGSLAGLS